jgi:hypothetical protein
VELIPYNSTVIILHPREDALLVNIGDLDPNPNNHDGNPSLCLRYDHPGYSAIFALLMASAVNKKPIRLEVSPFNPDEPAPKPEFACIVRAWYNQF